MELVKTSALISAFGLSVAFTVVIVAMVMSIHSQRQLMGEIPFIGYSPAAVYSPSPELVFSANSDNFAIDNPKVAGTQSQSFVEEFYPAVRGDNTLGLVFVNETRLKYDKEVLEYDQILNSTALIYAKQMANSCAKLAHSDLNSYIGSNTAKGKITSFSENLVWHSATMAGANRLIINSPTHAANLLGDHDVFGVGVAIAQNPACEGRIYMVQHFANTNN